jgi:cytochrome P450
MYRKGPLAFYQSLWRAYGDVVRIRLAPIAQYLLVRPDDIQHVLVHNWRNYCKGLGYREVRLIAGAGLLTSEGKQWQQQRRLAQPFFQARACTAFASAIHEAVEALLVRWGSMEKRREPLDVLTEMTNLTCRISARALLGCDWDDQLADVSKSLTDATQFLRRALVSPIPVPLFVPTPMNRRFKRGIRTVHAFLDNLIARRRHEPGGQNDLLALLLKAHDPEIGLGEGDGQLRDEVVTLLVAAHETTPLALTWTWHLLARRPEMEARLHDELERALGGRPPRPDDLPRLPFALRILHESMRLYPPVPLFVRDAIADDEVSGCRIQAGGMVVICPYLTHRHPAYWDAPEHFDPDRFSAERSVGRPGLAYLPFGGGPRVCVGQHLALLQMHLALAALAQHYRLRPVPGQRLESFRAATLHPRHWLLFPRHPLRAVLHRRR